MAEAAKNVDQNGESMEDILHSIRDIIADGVDDKKGKPAVQEVPAAEEEILELTEMIPVAAETPAPAETQQPEPAPAAQPAPTPAATNEASMAIPEEQKKDILSDIDFALNEQNDQSLTEIAPQMQEPPPAEPKQEQPAQVDPVQVVEDNSPPGDEGESLVSNVSAKAAEAALKNLMQSIPKPKIESPDFRGGSTVEDLVVEALKPMLSEWLDKNLPTIVEQLVQKEIRKLVPRD